MPLALSRWFHRGDPSPIGRGLHHFVAFAALCSALAERGLRRTRMAMKTGPIAGAPKRAFRAQGLT